MHEPAVARYVCDACGRIFVNDQLAFEENLIDDHDRLCHILPRLMQHVDNP